MRAGRPLLELSAAAVCTAALAACQDEVVQTAYLPPSAPPPSALDCRAATSNELPPGAAFGEGDTIDAWPLAALSYGALEGPGIYVTARDTFRVYVNGHLVGQSASAREPLFVPLSLMPGENVIAVAVHARAGTPAALVQVDELEQSYLSGGSWRVSTAPEGDWTAPGYDDAAWMPARDLGALGSLPGCDPATSFPSSTAARWIGPGAGVRGPIALRTVIRVEPIGFGAGTTGAGSATPELVSTWEALEALAASPDPALIVLAEGVTDFRRPASERESVEACPSVCAEYPETSTYLVLGSGATCANTPVLLERSERTLRVGSNKTILGLGRGAAVRGVSFDLSASQNVILRNLAVYDVNPALLEAGDAFTLTGASGVWIDHATTRWVSDAFLEVHPGSRGVTVSYSLFDGGTDGECGGQERWAATFNDSEATVHHTRFDQVSTRAPHSNGSEARVHLFNNVHSNTTDWSVGSGCLAQVRLEGSVFENTEAATWRSTCSDSAERGLMEAVASTNLYRDESAVHIGGDNMEPRDAVFVPEYPYRAELAADAWARVIARAGAGGPWALPLNLD